MKLQHIFGIIATISMTLTSCFAPTDVPLDTPAVSQTPVTTQVVATATPTPTQTTAPTSTQTDTPAPAENAGNASDMYVHFIDVGQADSILVQSNGENLLIDGGNVKDSSLVVSYLKDCGVETIDYLICTHAHEDHGGGLSGPLRVYNVENVLAPKTGSDAKFYQDFLSGVYDKGLEIQNPDVGYSFTIGDATATVLGPVSESTDELNDTSIVIKLVNGNDSFLFTGDAESDEEHDIVSRWQGNLDVDVLKVGHHGAKNSSSYSFLREVMPEYAVISVGKGNSYGHPTEEALSRLRDVGAQVYRTDLQGHIVAKSDGDNITFTTKKNENAQTNPTTSEKVESNYIGNKNSKKLHKPTCGSLPKESNRVYFSNMEEALSQGFVQCKNCF